MAGADILGPEIILEMYPVSYDDLELVIAINGEYNKLQREKAEKDVSKSTSKPKD